MVKSLLKIPQSCWAVLESWPRDTDLHGPVEIFLGALKVHIP
jgi:hypothetical protein